MAHDQIKRSHNAIFPTRAPSAVKLNAMTEPSNSSGAPESAVGKSAVDEPTIYELAGGQATFFRLCARFYDNVSRDALLRPLYPADLQESAWWLALFLMQYCGGPGDYSARRGHPRLRMRHLPFSIGQAERDAWMKNMGQAVESEIENEQVKAFLLPYFERTATFMMNRTE